MSGLHMDAIMAMWLPSEGYTKAARGKVWPWMYTSARHSTTKAANSSLRRQFYLLYHLLLSGHNNLPNSNNSSSSSPDSRHRRRLPFTSPAALANVT